MLAYLRMPLFTFLSGMVYAAYPVTLRSSRSFIKGKALRLLLPLITVGSLFAAVQAYTPHANYKLPINEITLIWVKPYAHFWFLQSLFLIFIALVALEVSGSLRIKIRFLMVFAVSCVLFLLRHNVSGMFSLDNALYLLPFFLAGVALRRFEALPETRFIYLLVCQAAALGLVAFVFNISTTQQGLNLSLGILAASLFVVCCPQMTLFRWLGAYSYSIYLYHVFGSAGSRIILSQLGLSNTLLLFCIGLVAGLTAGIVAHEICSRIPYVSRLFLGTRCKRRWRGTANSSKQAEVVMT